MSWVWKFVRSSIGKKLIVGLTGLGLCGFLVTHLAGNLLLFKGQDAFNGYAHALEVNPLLPLAELALAGLFGLHIYMAVTVTLENRAARPDGYEVLARKGGRNAANWTMLPTGVVVLAFLVWHLLNFRFADLTQMRDAHGYRDFYRLVLVHFQSLGQVSFYVVACCLLGLHVSHGLQSGFRSLGFNHPSYQPGILCASSLFGAGIAFGFSSIPIWAFSSGAQLLGQLPK